MNDDLMESRSQAVRVLILICVIAILAGSGQIDHSLDSVEMTVFSLDPYSGREKDQSQGEWLRGFRVLGKVGVVNSSIKRKINDGIAQGYAIEPKKTHDCFDPRHGVSIFANGERTDHVICFACGFALKVSQDESAGLKHFSSGSYWILNKVLTDAGIAIAD